MIGGRFRDTFGELWGQSKFFLTRYRMDFWAFRSHFVVDPKTIQESSEPLFTNFTQNRESRHVMPGGTAAPPRSEPRHLSISSISPTSLKSALPGFLHFVPSIPMRPDSSQLPPSLLHPAPAEAETTLGAPQPRFFVISCTTSNDLMVTPRRKTHLKISMMCFDHCVVQSRSTAYWCSELLK